MQPVPPKQRDGTRFFRERSDLISPWFGFFVFFVFSSLNSQGIRLKRRLHIWKENSPTLSFGLPSCAPLSVRGCSSVWFDNLSGFGFFTANALENESYSQVYEKLRRGPTLTHLSGYLPAPSSIRCIGSSTFNKLLIIWVIQRSLDLPVLLAGTKHIPNHW
jgi:hypothetical protein